MRIKNFNKYITMLVLALAGFAMSGCGDDPVESTGRIHGRIVDAATDEPLQGVVVTISPKGESTVTGSDGIYDFASVEPGQYSLQAQKADYKTNYKQVSVIAGEVAYGDMQLASTTPTSAIEISPASLEFSSSQTEKTITLRNKATQGTVNWSVGGIDVTWLRVSPTTGNISANMSEVIKVSVERDGLKDTAVTYFTISTPGGSQSVKVTVQP